MSRDLQFSNGAAKIYTMYYIYIKLEAEIKKTVANLEQLVDLGIGHT